jgi:hypothetical protein
MDTTTAFDRRIAAINKGEGRAWVGPIVEVVDTVQTLCLGLTEASGGVPPTDTLLAAALDAVMQRKARAEKVADDETAALRAAHGE